MSHATTPDKGPSTADCEVVTDIHTQSHLAEVEVVSLVQELIPRYRLRADTEFAFSNEDFIQTPRIDGSEFEPLTNTQIRALLDYYVLSSDRISQMTKTYHDINAVTRLLEERENDLQMAVNLGVSLLESNDSLRNQVTSLEQDIEQTTEIVKQLKHDLLLKERLIRFYYDMDLDVSPTESKQVDCQSYEQKIRHLEYENRELRAESVQLKLEAENFEQHEQTIVDHFAHALANANSEIETLQEEILKKNDENVKQHDELVRLTFEMREVHRRLTDLKKENDELRLLLSLAGKSCHEYETKIEDLEKHYSECLLKLHRSQQEINFLQNHLPNSPSSPTLEINGNNQNTVFLSPVDYANFMSLENSLKSELEEVREDPSQLCHSSIDKNVKSTRRRTKRSQCDTDGESSIHDSAFSDTESLSSSPSCRLYKKVSSIPNDEVSKSTPLATDRRLPSGISPRLRLVKRFEGSNMLKRWQELAEPSLSSCLETIPGVYTRAEILHDVKEENEATLLSPQYELDDQFSVSFSTHHTETPIRPRSSTCRINLLDILAKQGVAAHTMDSSNSSSDFEKAFLTCPLPKRFSTSITTNVPDPDDDDGDDFDLDNNEPTTPPSSPTYVSQIQTTAVLQQVIERLVKLSFDTFQSLKTSLISSRKQDQIEHHIDKPRLCSIISTKTPPSSPTFDGFIAPTPNTAMNAMKTSTFLRASSLNPHMHKSIHSALTKLSPGEPASIVDDLLRSHLRRI